MSIPDSNLRYCSLGFGVGYLVAAALAGFNQELVWELFSWNGIGGQARHLVSVLTTVFPHVIAIPGLALLIVGVRMNRRTFISVAVVPVVYTIACLLLRVSNL